MGQTEPVTDPKLYKWTKAVKGIVEKVGQGRLAL